MGDRVDTSARHPIKVELENEHRDIKDIWNDALRTYKGVLGEELKPTFRNVDDMIDHANKQMGSFQKWRHDGAKIDRLRSLFMGNIGFIQTATQKIIAAAEPAFPPAAAIGTAMTFILSACKSVSTDYDVVTAFFEDMNSFLQRVSILETRLPTYKAYQACLLDVFTALMKMCAFAQKFVRQGRLKKWVVNAFLGDDSDLGASRKGMDRALNRLESATEFAILANTENLKDGQEILRSMQQELQQNQERQTELQESQHAMLQTVLEGQGNVKNQIGDLKILLQALRSPTGDDAAANRAKVTRSVSNAVRTTIDDIPENELQLQLIQDTHVPGTCRWIFSEPTWKSWYTGTSSQNRSPLLLIRGCNGIGKSHLAATIYEQIERDISKDPSGSSCVVYFSSHESIAKLRSFQSLINWTLLQISETNVMIRNRLNTMLSQGPSRMPEKEYLQELIFPLFASTSQFHLHIVVDAVDAFETNEEKNSIFDFVRAIKQSDLRIKMVATMRHDSTTTKPHELAAKGWTSDYELTVTREKIMPDLTTIIQDRLQTSDSAFRGIRYLKTSVRERIASKLEEVADTPLYAEQSLLYLSDLAREAPIMKLLDTTMPEDVHGWFHKFFERCERRTPQDLASPLQLLLTWLLFSFNAINLDGINRLLRMATDAPNFDPSDDILDIYSAFLQVRSVSMCSKAAAQKPTFAVTGPGPAYEDATTQLLFRKRSMHEFFLRRRAANEKTDPSMTMSQGHRQLFLLCCRIIEEQSSLGTNEDLHKDHHELQQYALKYCLRHWQEICPEMHTAEENIAICKEFYELLDNKEAFASQIERKCAEGTVIAPLEAGIGISWDAKSFARWAEWSKWVQSMSIAPHEAPIRSHSTTSLLEYWSRHHSHALIPLAKAHAQNWLAAKEPNRAYLAYNLARKTVQQTSMQDILCRQYPVDALDSMDDDVTMSGGKAEGDAFYEEILKVRKVFGLSLDSNSHFATAILAKSVLSNAHRSIQEMEQAIEKCSSSVDKFRYLSYMAKLYYWDCFSLEDSLRYYQLALELRDQVPVTDILAALERKATMLYRDEKVDEATAVYEEVHSLDPESPVVDSLLKYRFIMYMRKADWRAVVQLFLEMNPIQRLKIALYWFNWHNRPCAGTHPAIIRGAIAAQKVDELMKIYSAIVASLDISSMGPLWMPFLAQIHWAWYGDTTSAKDVLVKALNTSCTVQTYPLAEVDAGFIAVRNVNMLSDILLEQFQKSGDLDMKVKLSEEASSLFLQHLPQSVQISDTSKIPHLLVLANMTRKVGTAQGYEKLLRQAFDVAWAILNDSITINDSDGVHYLCRVIGQISDFQREAEILGSTMLYYLGDSSFFVKFCKREGVDVEETAVIEFEKMLEGQTNDDRTDATSDHKELRNVYKKYKSTSANNFHTYESLIELELDEAWPWVAPICTRSTFCASRIDTNSLSRSHDTWDDGPLYTCLFCTNSVLCQACYDTRMTWNATGKPDGELSFCCANGKYIKCPTQGWLGVKFQSIYLEGEPPIKFDEFLQQIRAKWNEYWDRFWIG